MKHIHTFLLVAVGFVGLSVSGPVTMEGTAQIQQHNLERGQILDKRSPDFHIPGPIEGPPPHVPLPEPSDVSVAFHISPEVKALLTGHVLLYGSLSFAQFDLCMDACKSSHKHTDKACTAWCNKCIAQGHGNCH
ncbi:hypothetical protein V8E36_001875 [Tilletia maclaganii]